MWQELREIPGGEFSKSFDSLSLEVLVREGSRVVIHQDQEKQWKNSGGEIERVFQDLKAHHVEKFQSLLSPMLAQTSEAQPAGTGPSTASEQSVAAIADDDLPEVPDPAAGAAPEAVTTFESLEKLEAEDKIKVRTASELAGVELLKTESGKIFIFSEKAKVVPKHTILGGFGSGKFPAFNLANVC